VPDGYRIENITARVVNTKGINLETGGKLRLAEKPETPRQDMPTPSRPLEEIERDYIVRVFEETTWKID